MKAAIALLWILTVAVAFELGRSSSPGPVPSELATVDSFLEALEEREELARSYRISAFFHELGPDTLPDALEALEAHQVGFTEDEVHLLMLAWSRFDAPGAFSWASEWPTRWRETLMNEAAHAWGFRDGPAALAAIETEADVDLREKLKQRAVRGWIRSDDRLGVAAYIAQHPDPRQRRHLTFRLTGDVMKEGAEAAMRFAEAVPVDAPNGFKRDAFKGVAGKVARWDPPAAAAWFEAHRDRDYSRGTATLIATKWAEYYEPRDLFAWLRALPADDEASERERTGAIDWGFRTWYRKAPAEAEEWLEAETPDAALDPALVRLLRDIQPDSRLLGVEWAERIADPVRRRNALVSTARVWLQRDPDAATRWLAKSDLSEDVLEAIRSPRPGPGALPVRSSPAGPQSG